MKPDRRWQLGDAASPFQAAASKVAIRATSPRDASSIQARSKITRPIRFRGRLGRDHLQAAASPAGSRVPSFTLSALTSRTSSSEASSCARRAERLAGGPSAQVVIAVRAAQGEDDVERARARQHARERIVWKDLQRVPSTVSEARGSLRRSYCPRGVSRITTMQAISSPARRAAARSGERETRRRAGR
jgi:hypothetical protein